MGHAKTKRGTVAVETFQGFLRLRWSYLGKRHCLTLGMPDSKVNRTVAESKARAIEGDLATDNFDPTLKKYKRQRDEPATEGIRTTELLQRFIEYKKKSLGASISKYTALKKPVLDFFGGQLATAVDEESADNFRLHLARRIAPATLRDWSLD